MRIAVNLDDVLLAAAQDASGLTECAALIHAGLQALTERESARRLGGSEAQLKMIRRRRPRSAHPGKGSRT
ncbi:MAG: type II toxin-antitoxin system VapB family antitoxin [Casimicrobiaceae bacterium]